MEQNLDPRFVRTRKLIMEAFKKLVIDKDFKDITIKDITTMATVNRSTFYYHFLDKYDLLERILREDVLNGVLENISLQESLTPEILKNIFFSILNFQKGLANKCIRSYETFKPKIETIVKEELERIFKKLLKEKYPEWTKEKLDLQSILMSWSLYGMSTKYLKTKDNPTEKIIEEIFDSMIIEINN